MLKILREHKEIYTFFISSSFQVWKGQIKKA